MHAYFPAASALRRLPSLRTHSPAHKFGILHVHDVKATLAKKGVEYGPRAVIYEVCNPRIAKALIEHHISVLTYLPCRICVHGPPPGDDDGETRVQVMRPSAIAGLYKDESLRAEAAKADEAVVAIVNEVAAPPSADAAAAAAAAPADASAT